YRWVAEPNRPYQQVGNEYEIVPLTEENYDRYIRPISGVDRSLAEYLRLWDERPEEVEGAKPTHVLLVRTEQEPEMRAFRVGPLDHLREYMEARERAGWFRRVDAFAPTPQPPVAAPVEDEGLDEQMPRAIPEGMPEQEERTPTRSATGAEGAIRAVPDSVFSAFPDMAPADSGLIPIQRFTLEEQAALRAAGLVETGTLESGETHEGVDPEKLWPERERRAAAAR